MLKRAAASMVTAIAGESTTPEDLLWTLAFCILLLLFTIR
jgi:hypothetical protein